MTLDEWLKADPRRSFLSCYSRSAGDHVVFVRDPGERREQIEIHGDTKIEAEENARARLGIE
jgi:hypothetical protein